MGIRPISIPQKKDTECVIENDIDVEQFEYSVLWLNRTVAHVTVNIPSENKAFIYLCVASTFGGEVIKWIHQGENVKFCCERNFRLKFYSKSPNFSDPWLEEDGYPSSWSSRGDGCKNLGPLFGSRIATYCIESLSLWYQRSLLLCLWFVVFGFIFLRRFRNNPYFFMKLDKFLIDTWVFKTQVYRCRLITELMPDFRAENKLPQNNQRFTLNLEVTQILGYKKETGSVLDKKPKKLVFRRPIFNISVVSPVMDYKTLIYNANLVNIL
ncbi:hypothetical protein L9F63_011190, partial [Diploptera punctata]